MTNSNRDLDLLVKYFAMALYQVYAKDFHLIEYHVTSQKYHVGERSIVFRFSLYLQNILNSHNIYTDYNLDCEYNRNGPNAKKLPSFSHGTYPDLILHKRASNEFNILVAEFKGYWSTYDQNGDVQKIKEFTNRNGTYKFKLGVTIKLMETFESCEVKFYQNGEKSIIFDDLWKDITSKFVNMEEDRISSPDTHTVTSSLDLNNPIKLTSSQRAQFDALNSLTDDTVRKRAEADPDCEPLE